jgi:ubiquinone/menaquinone biosynthesis C-methylase UbiE
VTDDWRALNLAFWEERAAIHTGPRGYDRGSHRAGRGRLDAIVEAELGSVAGQRVLHLQCHVGDDSVAIAQRGAAEVVGVDFSPASIAAARALAAECGTAHASFVESDVLAAPHTMPAEAASFDRVFVSWGAIGWLPDIAAWARVVAHFLRPGGSLYIAEAHPAALVFDDITGSTNAEGLPGWLVPYFDRGARAFDEQADYADPAACLAHTRFVSWMHPLGDIVSALVAAGLRIDWLHEHPRVAWKMFASLMPAGDALWGWPEKPWLPLSFSLSATRA